MEENDEQFLANPINMNEKSIKNNIENNSKINGIDKIIVYYYSNCCLITIYIFFSIFFIVFPFIFYFLLISLPYKRIFYVDEEETELVAGNQGVFACCMGCVKDKNIYIIKDINKVIIYTESKSYSKEKIVDCELYMTDGNKVEFFKGLTFNDEKLDEVEAFFARHFDIQIVSNSEQKAYTNK